MATERSIRDLITAAVEEKPELAENSLIKFWKNMSPQQEEIMEHLRELDRREVEAEIGRARAEESAA